MSTRETTITVDRAKLRAVLANMPAWPLVSSSTVTLGDHFLDDLARFADRLAVFFAEREADRQELSQLRADLLAVRRVLGVTA